MALSAQSGPRTSNTIHIWNKKNAGKYLEAYRKQQVGCSWGEEEAKSIHVSEAATLAPFLDRSRPAESVLASGLCNV